MNNNLNYVNRMLWLLFLMTVSCGPANLRDWEKKNSDNIC